VIQAFFGSESKPDVRLNTEDVGILELPSL